MGRKVIVTRLVSALHACSSAEVMVRVGVGWGVSIDMAPNYPAHEQLNRGRELRVPTSTGAVSTGGEYLRSGLLDTCAEPLGDRLRLLAALRREVDELFVSDGSGALE